MDTQQARAIIVRPILMGMLVASVLVGCSHASSIRAGDETAAASQLSAGQIALAASALPEFTLVEDHSRTLEDIAALYPDPAASAADLSAHGFRESWLREFVRPGLAGHTIRVLNIVSVYAQENGSRWALRHNLDRIQSLTVGSLTVLPISLGDESYAYNLEWTGPTAVVRSTTLYIRVSNVSYTLVETGLAADVDAAALVELARAEVGQRVTLRN
jgi:hypothetical protein